MRTYVRNYKRQKIGYVDIETSGKMTVHDASGNKLGKIKPERNCLVAYDRFNNKLGKWKENEDCTYDASGRKICKANVLIGLYFNP